MPIANLLYFWFSLTYLFARTILLSLYSSSIEDAAQSPLIHMRKIPSEIWDIEVMILKKLFKHSLDWNFLAEKIYG